MSELGSEMDALPNTSTNIWLEPTSPAMLDCDNNRMSTPYNYNAPNPYPCSFDLSAIGVQQSDTNLQEADISPPEPKKSKTTNIVKPNPSGDLRYFTFL